MGELSVTVIWGHLLFMVEYVDDGHRDLPMLLSLVANHFDENVALMRESAAPFGPTLRDLGGQLAALMDREKASVLTSTLDNLSFVASPALARNLSVSTFRPDDLRDRLTTVYLSLPVQYQRSHGRWLRVVLVWLFRGLSCGAPSEARPVYFFVDEVPALGFFPQLADAMAMLRGFGLRFWLCAQARSQLAHVVGKDQIDALEAVTNHRHMIGINDVETATSVSRAIGDTTVEIDMETDSTTESGPPPVNYRVLRYIAGWSLKEIFNKSGPVMPDYQKQISRNVSRSKQRHQRALITPGELIALDRSTALLLGPDTPPAKLQKVNYFTDPEFHPAPPTPFQEWAALAAALAVFALTSGLAVLIW